MLSKKIELFVTGKDNKATGAERQALIAPPWLKCFKPAKTSTTHYLCVWFSTWLSFLPATEIVAAARKKNSHKPFSESWLPASWRGGRPCYGFPFEGTFSLKTLPALASIGIIFSFEQAAHFVSFCSQTFPKVSSCASQWDLPSSLLKY